MFGLCLEFKRKPVSPAHLDIIYLVLSVVAVSRKQAKVGAVSSVEEGRHTSFTTTGEQKWSQLKAYGRLESLTAQHANGHEETTIKNRKKYVIHKRVCVHIYKLYVHTIYIYIKIKQINQLVALTLGVTNKRTDNRKTDTADVFAPQLAVHTDKISTL